MDEKNIVADLVKAGFTESQANFLIENNSFDAGYLAYGATTEDLEDVVAQLENLGIE